MLSINPHPFPNRPIRSMDDHIGLAFSGDAFGFTDSRALLAVFGGDALIPLPPYGPAVLIRHHMLVPGSGSGAVAGLLEDYLDDIQ